MGCNRFQDFEKDVKNYTIRMYSNIYNNYPNKLDAHTITPTQETSSYEYTYILYNHVYIR